MYSNRSQFFEQCKTWLDAREDERSKLEKKPENTLAHSPGSRSFTSES